MKGLHYITFTLLAVGGLNWGLVGGFDFDLVTWIFGPGTGFSNIIYVLVGLSALYEILTHSKSCKSCRGKKKMTGGSNDMEM